MTRRGTQHYHNSTIGGSAMVDIIREVILPRLEAIRPSGGGGFTARCPAHEDRKPSLVVAPGRDQPVIFTCHADCDRDDILAAIGLTWTDVCRPRDSRPSTVDETWMPCRHQATAVYHYTNPDGALVFGVSRCGEKHFAQWRPDPTSRSGRRWSLTLPDGTRAGEGLLYRLPEVLAAMAEEPFPRNVFICEGEKDVSRLWSEGHSATCNAGGAGKWTGAHARWLTGADVIIIVDRDEPGWRHGEQVANSLLDVARTVEVVRPAAGKDYSDHAGAGLSIDELVTVATPKADQ